MDCTGIKDVLLNQGNFRKEVKNFHIPFPEDVDLTMVLGVNENIYDNKNNLILYLHALICACNKIN